MGEKRDKKWDCPEQLGIHQRKQVMKGKNKEKIHSVLNINKVRIQIKHNYRQLKYI